MPAAVEIKCPKCGHIMNKDGGTPTGRQRWECPDCGKKTSTPPHVSVGGFGGHLRIIREAAGLTQQFVSEQLDHDRSWLSRIEAGDRQISIEEMFSLAEIYHMRASEILVEYERLRYPD